MKGHTTSGNTSTTGGSDWQWSSTIGECSA